MDIMTDYIEKNYKKAITKSQIRDIIITTFMYQLAYMILFMYVISYIYTYRRLRMMPNIITPMCIYSGIYFTIHILGIWPYIDADAWLPHGLQAIWVIGLIPCLITFQKNNLKLQYILLSPFLLGSESGVTPDVLLPDILY